MSAVTVSRDSTDPPLVVLFADEDHAVGTWGPVLIQVSRGAPTGPLSAKVNEIATRFIETSARPVSCLFVIERGSPPPDEACRKNLAAFSRDIVSRMSISVAACEGGGFRAALVRAVGVTLTTILPHSSKFKFVNDLDAAVRAMAPYFRPYASNSLTAAVEELRAKIGSSKSTTAASSSLTVRRSL